MTRLLSAFLLIACAASAQPPRRTSWGLRTGEVRLQLLRDADAINVFYFGPVGSPKWQAPSPAISGIIEGRRIEPSDFALVSARGFDPGDDERPAVFRMRHGTLPLELEVRYTAWGETGALSRQVRAINVGSQPLHIQSLPSLALQLPPGSYELSYLYGGWGQERQLATEPLTAGSRVFENLRGRSSSLYSPWLAIRDTREGITYAAQLEWSGNWRTRLLHQPGTGDRPIDAQPLALVMEPVFDNGGTLVLAPGANILLPAAVFTAVRGDLDDAANSLHRYQRRFVFPARPDEEPLLVQFNSWYPFQGKTTVDEMKRYATAAAALGAEAFVLDSGWYNLKDWSKELGDYEADKAAYPNGIEELSAHVRKLGLQFGIWVEIENAGVQSRLAAEHPGWFLQLNGKPILKGDRYQLNFANPEVQKWARGVIDRLVRDYHLEWIKIDYNIDIGNEFDTPDNTALWNHLQAYYAWLDRVREAYPDLLIENCASGGLRFDNGIMRHTHTTWLSDEVRPKQSVQLAYGCTVEFAPQVCNHWTVGDKDNGEINPQAPSGWWDFVFRVPMNGQFGLSSKILDWSPALRANARENIALYKRLRSAIAESDVYHLTPPPSHDAPQGWTALQYVQQGALRSVIMAYRCQGGEAASVFKPRALHPDTAYRVSVDGKPRGVMQGKELMSQGVKLELDEWRSAVVEIEWK